MSLTEFWNMPPFAFAQKVEGYFERENRAAYYFREQFALQLNMHRKEGAAALSGYEILPLFGEKKPKGENSGGVMSKAKIKQMEAWADRANQQEKREREAIDLAIQELKEFGMDQPPPRLPSENNHDYTIRLVKLKERYAEGVMPAPTPPADIIKLIKSAGLNQPCQHAAESYPDYLERMYQFYQKFKP